MGIKNTDIVIIGAGILGTTLSYIISSLSNTKIILIDQENKVAYHTSSRNTGKVHAPFIYDPEKKKVFAKAALFGYIFWNNYCNFKKICFKEDGIIEVATDDKSTQTIYKHFKWGIDNGLEKKDIQILEQKDVEKFEPNVRCQTAIFCKKDASVDYGEITNSLAIDAIKNKVDVILQARINKIAINPQFSNKISIKYVQYPNGSAEKEIKCDFFINAAGGNALYLLNNLNPGLGYQNLYFRGEYWIAPSKYKNLTNRSIYSVPKFHKFPFLDPHWIIRTNGNREIGPNACLVFSQYGYDSKTNLKEFFPKVYEFAKGSKIKKIKNILFNKEISELILKEMLSSLSKTHMINRVKKFLPSIKSSDFITKGTAGIRANLIDKDGGFVLNPLFLLSDNALHIVNYNSPGATGSFSIGFALFYKLIEKGIIKKDKEMDTHFFNEKLILDCIKEVDIILFKI